MAETPLLEVRDLVTVFDSEEGELRAVDNVSFSLTQGKTLGLVGESGCGKSVTALSILRLLPKPSGRTVAGQVLFAGRDLLTLAPEEMIQIRGAKISMIFQEPMTALNPVHTIGRQITETLHIHDPRLSKRTAAEKALQLLKQVGIPDPERRFTEYPHLLSGGMRQRVLIAIALACGPDLLIADEPTTALDVTIQAQILDLMRRLQREHGMAIIFITHDLGVVAEMCDDVLVMYGGRVAETGTVEEIFHAPRHPYTRALLSSIPRLDTPAKSLLVEIPGTVPDLAHFPAGCRFRNRCALVLEDCAVEPLPIERFSPTHEAVCVRARELANG